MLAAADYADDPTKEPPRELKLALQCRSWGGLPYPGTILDQPYGLLENMTIALNVFNAMQSAKSAGDMGKWAEANPDMAAIYASIWKLRHDAD